MIRKTRTTFIALVAAFSFAATIAPTAQAMPSTEQCKLGRANYDRDWRLLWSFSFQSQRWNEMRLVVNSHRNTLYEYDCSGRRTRPWIDREGRPYDENGY